MNISKKKGYEIPRNKDKKGRYTVKHGTKVLVDVIDLTKGSGVKVTKVCDICGKHTEGIQYSAILLARESGDGVDRCNKCARKLLKENAVFEKSLEYYAKSNNKEYLLKEFSIKNKITCDKVFKSSNDIFYWECNKCDSIYSQSINTRTNLNVGCPYCAGKKVNHTNSLAKLNSELSSEWHPIKNGEVTPHDVTCGSNKKVWWQCKENHEWESKVNTRKEKGCPYCYGRFPTESNNLAFNNPELLKEWNYDKNIKKPTEYMSFTDSKVWWLCSEGHEWESSVSGRSFGNGCPICAETKGERRIRRWAENKNITIISQIEFDNLFGLGGGKLSYDFYLPEYNLLIEYQGEFHDGSNGEYTKINLTRQQEHDRRKREYADQNGYELLEIWYYDFDNVERILDSRFYSESF